MSTTDTRLGAPTMTSTAPAVAADPTSRRHWTGASRTSPWLLAAEGLIGPLSERAAEHDRDNTFVDEAYDLLRECRMMSMLVPTAIGGGGASLAETCALLAELAHGCPATALAFSMHHHLVAAQVWRHHRDLPAPVLTKVADAELVLVSTGASDWLASNGTATKVEGGFRVIGRKAPASGAPAGDILVTSVRWEDGPDGPQVIHAAVPFSADGVSIELTWDTMGMRATGSHTVVLDDVFVPDAAIALTRPADVWHPVWSTVLGVAMPLIMSAYVGVAEAAATRAVTLAVGRDPSVSAPLVGRMLTHLAVARDVARAMIDSAENLRFDNTIDLAAMTLARKTAVATAVLDTTRLALEAGGGRAFSTDAGIERLHRDAHGTLFHPLPAAQQAMFTGRAALGLDPVG